MARDQIDVLGRSELASSEWWSVAFPLMQSSVPGSVSFRHDVLRQASHDSLPSRRRRQLHDAIAERYVDSVDVSDVELAFHYEQADMLAEACSCARAAGLDAKNRNCSSLRPRSPW